MAAIDYENRGSASITPHARLSQVVWFGDTSITVSGYKGASSSGDLFVGMAVMVGDEIMRLESTDLPTLSVSRGCADTIPSLHLPPEDVWFFSRSAGSDSRQYLASETVTAKMTNRTIYGGSVPVEKANPHPLAFDWRQIRPYPPGKFLVNGLPWHSQQFVLSPSQPTLTLTWANRNRVTQADQLVSHDESNIDGEVTQKCAMNIYRSDGVTIGAGRLDITGTSLTLSRSEMSDALGGLNATGFISFGSVRGPFLSWQRYVVNVQVSDSDIEPLALSENVVVLN